MLPHLLGVLSYCTYPCLKWDVPLNADNCSYIPFRFDADLVIIPSSLFVSAKPSFGGLDGDDDLRPESTKALFISSSASSTPFVQLFGLVDDILPTYPCRNLTYTGLYMSKETNLFKATIIIILKRQFYSIRKMYNSLYCPTATLDIKFMIVLFKV